MGRQSEHGRCSVSLGFLNDSKGAVEIIRALKCLRDGGMQASLMMIGGAVSSSNASNQPYYDLVLQTIAELGLDDDVFWTGYVPNDQVSAAFKSSDMCVLPFSDGASFRRGSLMAALTHGAAIISTHPQVPVPEIVDRENMLLVPPENVEALVRAIKDVAATTPCANAWRPALSNSRTSLAGMVSPTEPCSSTAR